MPNLLSRRFVVFVTVGFSGLGVNLGVLGLVLNGLGWPFLASQVAAVTVAMTTNFALNNWITYRDRRLHGRDILRGLGTFYVACLIGAGANLAVAETCYALGGHWALAGFLGAVAGSIWNFASTAKVTWREPAAQTRAGD